MKKELNKIPLIILTGFIIVCVFSSEKLMAQDAQFSQFYNSPLTLNPSLTGAFSGDMRLLMNYRDQWSSIPVPYKTFAFSFDMGLMKKKEGTGFLGLGLSFLSDMAGSSEMGLNQVNLSVAYHVRLSDYSTFAAGIIGGFTQSSIDFSKLQWSSQYDGCNYNPNLPSYETGCSQNKSYPDFGSGVEWTFTRGEIYATANNQLSVNAGLAVFHVNQPNISFYSTEKDPLPVKIVFHGTSQIGLNNSKYSVEPSFIYIQQGASRDIIAGASLRIKLQEESKYTGFNKGAAMSLGCDYRFGDAVIPQAQLEFANYAMGLSYDVNTSGLSSATSGKGGIEVSIRWINLNPFTGGKSLTKSARFFN